MQNDPVNRLELDVFSQVDFGDFHFHSIQLFQTGAATS